MFTRAWVCLCVCMIAAAQSPWNTFPLDAASSGPASPAMRGVPEHDFPGLDSSRWERADSLNAPDPDIYRRNAGPGGPVSVEQLRHPLSGKALGMIKKAEKLIAAKDYARAREELRKAAKDQSAAPYAHSLLGQEYVREMQFQEAIGELQQALRELPSSIPDHANLGYALMMTGRVEESEKELKRALELQPENPRTHLVMGILCYTVKGRDQEAEEHMQFAARELPSAHLMLARFYFLIGRAENAEKELKAYERVSGPVDAEQARIFMSGARALLP